MAVCTAHSNADSIAGNDAYAEIGISTLPCGDTRIRQRMEASRHGMLQLESLRSKHQKLMEQLRNEYPDYTQPLKLLSHDKKSPLHAAAIFNAVSSNMANFHEHKFDEAIRCESPISSCVSHRSSVSIDSGYTSISSEHGTLNHQPPMSYGTYRMLTTSQKAQLDSLTDEEEPKREPLCPMPSPTESVSEQQIVATAIESTTAVKPSSRVAKSWQRPKSMYDEVSDSRKLLDELKYENLRSNTLESDKTPSLYSPIKPRNHQEGKLMDSLSFSQLTPPPSQRRFGQEAREKKPIPPARKTLQKFGFSMNHAPQQMPIRAVNAVQARPQSQVFEQPKIQPQKSTQAYPLAQAQVQLQNPSFPTSKTQPQVRSHAQIQLKPPSPKNTPIPTAKHDRRPLRTAQKPQFATISPVADARDQKLVAQKLLGGSKPVIFHASRIYVDRSTSSSNESSPETPRPRRVFPSKPQKPMAQVVKYENSEEDGTSSDYAVISKEEVDLAQPAIVLSRQQSSTYSSESSPAESRKLFMPHNSSNKVFTVYAKPFADRIDESSNVKPSSIARLRKEKVWHESEQL